MTTTYKGNGDFDTYTCTGNVTKGDVKIQQQLAGVALDSGVTGDLITLQLVGKFTVLRTAAATLTAKGANVYFTAAGAAIATATGGAIWGGKLAEAVSATGNVTAVVNMNMGSSPT